MKKILVPTDFSGNSKAGVRFAMLLAERQKLELVFIHVVNILRASRWSDAYYESYARQEEEIHRQKLETYIGSIYSELSISPGKRSFVVLNGLSPDISLLDYSRNARGIDLICISTRGAGKLKKIFGTNTGNLITRSEVPVLAVPRNYKGTGISRILYASDLMNYASELKKVIAIAEIFEAAIDVVHFAWPEEIMPERKKVEALSRKPFKYGLNLHFEEDDGMQSFIDNLEKQVSKRKPGMLVMFTNQQRTFFQKLFSGSRAEQVAFRIKVPLLVFNKAK